MIQVVLQALVCEIRFIFISYSLFFFFLIFLAMNEWHLVIRISRVGKKQDSFLLFILFCFEIKLILCYWYFLIFIFLPRMLEFYFSWSLVGFRRRQKWGLTKKWAVWVKRSMGGVPGLRKPPQAGILGQDACFASLSSDRVSCSLPGCLSSYL